MFSKAEKVMVCINGIWYEGIITDVLTTNWYEINTSAYGLKYSTAYYMRKIS